MHRVWDRLQLPHALYWPHGQHQTILRCFYVVFDPKHPERFQVHALKGPRQEKKLRPSRLHLGTARQAELWDPKNWQCTWA